MKTLVVVGVLCCCADAFAGRFAFLARSQQENRYERLVKRWAERGVDLITAVDVEGNNMLHIAAWSGNLVAAKYWLANGADINALNNQDESPLYVALESGSTKVADFYLSKGAQFTVNIEIANPTIVAAYRGETKILKKMLKGGADPNATDVRHFGQTPLGVAYHRSIIKLLLKTDGIEVNKPDRTGRTPLHYRALRGRLSAVKDLIVAGANPDAIDENGKKPADLAEESLSDSKLGSIDGIDAEFRKIIDLLRSLEFNFEPVH